MKEKQLKGEAGKKRKNLKGRRRVNSDRNALTDACRGRGQIERRTRDEEGMIRPRFRVWREATTGTGSLREEKVIL